MAFRALFLISVELAAKTREAALAALPRSFIYCLIFMLLNIGAIFESHYTIALYQSAIAGIWQYVVGKVSYF